MPQAEHPVLVTITNHYYCHHDRGRVDDVAGPPERRGRRPFRSQPAYDECDEEEYRREDLCCPTMTCRAMDALMTDRRRARAVEERVESLLREWLQYEAHGAQVGSWIQTLEATWRDLEDSFGVKLAWTRLTAVNWVGAASRAFSLDGLCVWCDGLTLEVCRRGGCSECRGEMAGSKPSSSRAVVLGRGAHAETHPKRDGRVAAVPDVRCLATPQMAAWSLVASLAMLGSLGVTLGSKGIQELVWQLLESWCDVVMQMWESMEDDQDDDDGP